MKSRHHEHSNRNSSIKQSSIVPIWALMLTTSILASHAALGASTYVWNNSGTDAYTNAANWTPNVVPGSADIANLASGGTALIDSTMNPVLFSLLGGGSDMSSGNITMSGGTLSITNNSNANLFLAGYYLNSSCTFTMNGGTFNVVRPSSGNRYYQDGLQPGFGIGATGTITINNGGTLNCFCGFECGIDGSGILNVNGGTFLDNGWFTIGKGAGGAGGSGAVYLTAGTIYALRNPSTDPFIRLQYGVANFSTPGTLDISGGTLYCHGIRFCQNNQAGTATLNVSGGTLYISEAGIDSGTFKAGQVQVVNISGGTFRTLCMDPNSTGQMGLSSIYIGGAGTNWTWALNNQPHVNLTTSPGPGTVTFAPEAGKTITLNNQWDGNGAFAVTGPGTVVFGTNNTYTGGTTVSGGTLQLNYNQPSAIISGLAVNSGATLILAVAELGSPIGAATFSSGSTLTLATGAQIVDSTLTLPSGVTLAFTTGNTQYLSNNVAGAINLLASMGGNGMEVVSGNLGHSGTTTVTGGILDIAGTLNNSSGVLVTNTGTLAGGGTISVPISIGSTTSPTSAHLRMGSSPMNVPGTLTVNDINLGAGTEVDVKLGTATTTGGGVNDLLAVNGNLTIDPNVILNVLPVQQLTAGTYVIATYSGTLSGTFSNAVGSLSRYGFSLDYSTTGQIKLNVTGSNANLVWQYTNAVWDVQTTWNWTNSAGQRTNFMEGDAVTFDDTTTNATVQIATTLYPASITFNGTSNYSITGTGSARISGATGVTKNGTGTVLFPAGLGLGNDYTGPVNVNNGIFKMNGALSLGATNGATYVASIATLDINGQTPNDEPMYIQGTGYGGTNGAINNSSGTSQLNGGPRKITLQGDTTLNASGARWDVGINTLGAGGGYFAGNGYKLTKIGAQQIWMHEVGDIGVGDIVVTQSTLGFQYTIGMGDSSKTATVYPGATLGIWQTPTLSKQVVLTNGATLYSDGASNALSGTITLYGTNTLQVNQPIGILSPITGTGGFQKTSGGTLYLPAVNIYSGPTFVLAGRVLFGPAGSIANSSLIYLATNTVLDASQPAGGLSVASGQILAGSGSVNGNASAGTGAQIAPGTAATFSTLTFNNDLALNGGTNVIKLGTDPNTIGNGVNDLVNVVGNLTASGVSTILISPLGTLNGASPYTVMTYGSGSAPSAANLHVASTGPRYNVTLVTPSSTPNAIKVNISGNAGELVWKGGVAGKLNTWDNSTTNWLNLGTSLRDAYFTGDHATLDDTSSTNLINLVAPVAGLTSLSNNTTAYTIYGSGTMAGTLDMEGTSSTTLAISNVPTFSITPNSGTLIYDVQGLAVYTNLSNISDNGGGLGTIVKAGTNTMIMSGPDISGTFSGALVISNGILRYTNASCLGGSGKIYATNSGSMDVNAIPSGSKVVVIAGDGFNGQGAVIDLAGTQIANEGVHNITMLADSSISAGTGSRWDLYGGAGGTLTANGFKLTKLGAGVILINAVGATGLGDIHVVAGRLGFQGSADMGDSSKTLTIESNAVLTLYDVSPDDNKDLVMNGGAIFDSAGNGSGNTIGGAVTLVGANNLFGLRKNLRVSDKVTGSGSFAAGDSPVGAGTGTLYLDGANDYTGSTTISNGHSIVVGASSSLGTSSLITVNSGATLDVSAPAFLALGTSQTMIGAGTVTGGNVVFNSGSTLAPGFPDNNTYTLTMSGSLTLNSGSTNRVVVKKTTSVANDMVSGLTSVSIGGGTTLVINNVGNALVAGDAIQLFSAPSYSGSFSTIVPATPGAGLVWSQSTLSTDGKLRVAAIAYPGISSITTDGSNVTLSGTNGPPNAFYNVLTNANVVLPLNQWMPMGTGQFDGSGNFSWTIPIISGQPALFYRVQLQ